MAMTSQTVLRCAVAGAHEGIDLGEVLADSGVAVLDVAFGANPVATMRRANFVVAFLEADAPSTLVDVGIAVALKKPLLLVAESSLDIPDRLLGYPWLLTEGLAYEDLALQIVGFASAFLPKPTIPRDTSTARLRKRGDQLVPEIPRRSTKPAPRPTSQQLAREQFHSDTEFQVAQTLSRAGAAVVAQMREISALTIPDLAASFPNLGPSFSTVLVEIGGRKTRLSSKKAALRVAMEERDLQLAMLVTFEELEDAEPDPGILVMSLHRLDELVETNQLLPTLRLARNRVVHRVN